MALELNHPRTALGQPTTPLARPVPLPARSALSSGKAGAALARARAAATLPARLLVRLLGIMVGEGSNALDIAETQWLTELVGPQSLQARSTTRCCHDYPEHNL